MPIVKNEINNLYNHLRVIKEDTPRDGRKYWVCQCENCKNIYTFSGTDLRKGNKDCPFCEKIGKIYGDLKVAKFSHTSIDRHKYWVCQCKCGNIDIIRASDLNSGKRTRCNLCNKKDRIKQYIDETGNTA